MLLLDKIAEEAIRSAVALGELDNLPGQGKPIVLDDNSGIPPELRAGYRILKNGGYLPPELVLHTEIKQVEDLLRQANCDVVQKPLVVRLSLLKSQLKTKTC